MRRPTYPDEGRVARWTSVTASAEPSCHLFIPLLCQPFESRIRHTRECDFFLEFVSHSNTNLTPFSAALQKNIALRFPSIRDTRDADGSHCTLEVGNPFSGLNLLDKLRSRNDLGVGAKL